MSRRAIAIISAGLLGTAAFLAGCGGSRVRELNSYAGDLARADQWEEAKYYLDRALKIAPEDPAVLNNLAVYFEQLSRFEEARELYQRALRAGGGSRVQKNLTALEDLLEASEAGMEADR